MGNTTGINQWLESHISLHNHDSRSEEMWNGGTHLLGAVLALVGTVMMLIKAATSDIPGIGVGVSIFGATMILLYGASSAYHYMPHGNLKRVFRILDHSNIYFLIAGTYTPICYNISGRIGTIMLSLVWGIAAVGIIFTLVFWGRLKPLHVVVYLVMGWMVVFFWDSVSVSLTRDFLFWMIGGGVCYTVGVIFYAAKKLPHYHAIWHLFVVGGSTLFFMGIYLHLI